MPDSDSIQNRIKELLDEWECRRAAGDIVEVEELCVDDPDCLEAVRLAISQRPDMDRPLNTTICGGSLDPKTPEMIGEYRLLEETARGGSSVVYRARQESLSREVAVKLLRTTDQPEQALIRFERETRALALLNHPAIATVFDAGVADTGQGLRPYIVMEFIHGRPLGAYINQGNCSLEARLQLFLEVCDGLHAAHEHGVIHRDIKPSNIMVTDDGRPRICDFGLATIQHSEIDTLLPMTKSSEILGTLQYMSPEHVSVNQSVDQQSDVYSLGIILYELVAEARPYQTNQQSVYAAIATIRDYVPRPVREHCPQIHRDLETIVIRAIDKDRGRRYASAAALADDIRRYVSHRPITARSVSVAERFGRWARRNPVLTLSLFVTVVALIAGISASTFYAIDAHNQSVVANGLAQESQSRLEQISTEVERANRLRDEAQQNAKRARRAVYNATLGKVQTVVESDPQLALQWLNDTDRCPPEWRGFSWRLMRRLAQRDRHVLAGHAGGTRDVRFSGDGQRLVSLGNEGGIRVWDASSGELLAEFEIPEAQIRIAVSSDGRRIASQAPSGEVLILDVDAQTVAARRRFSDTPATQLAWGTDDAVILIGTRDGVIDVWDHQLTERKISISVGTSHVAWLRMTAPDTVVSVTGTGEFVASSIQAGTVLRSETLHDAKRNLWGAISPDSRIFAVAPSSNYVRVFHLPGSIRQTPISVRERIYGVQCTSSPFRVLVACKRRIRVLDPDAGEIGAIRHGFDQIVDFDLAEQTDVLAVAGDTGEIALLSARMTPPNTSARHHSSAIVDVASGRKSERFITIDEDGRLILSQNASGRPINELVVDSIGRCRGIALAADETRLVVAGQTQIALVRVDADSLKHERTIDVPAQTLDVDFSPDCSRVAVACRDGFVRIYAAETGELVRELHGGGECLRVRFTPQGDAIATGKRSGSIVVWDVSSGEQTATWEAHQGKLFDLEFLHDGTQLYSCAGDGLIRLWDFPTGQLAATLNGHRDQILCLRLSPDGSTLASGGRDRQLILWDAHTGEMQLQFQQTHGDWVKALDFSADGRRLVTTGLNDINTRIWHAPVPVESPASEVSDRNVLSAANQK